MKAPIEDLVLHDRCQSRAELRQEAIDDYAQAYESGAKLPDVDVWKVDGALVVVDGFHRVAAARKAGVGFMGVNVVGSGTMDQAAWAALAVNTAHGLRRSNADKRRAVGLALDHPIGQGQSDVAIAEQCGVSDWLVADVRKKLEMDTNLESLEVGAQPPEITRPAKRIGRDGKVRPAKRRPRGERVGPVPGTRAQVTAVPMPDYGGALTVVAKLIRSARRKAMHGLPLELVALKQHTERQLKDAEMRIKLAVPVLCPACDGGGCTKCADRGWLSTSEASQWKATAKQVQA